MLAQKLEAELSGGSLKVCLLSEKRVDHHINRLASSARVRW